MNELTLHVGMVAIETEVEETFLPDAEPAIREAFRLLGERLERTPFRQWGQAREHALERLSVEMTSPDELFGARGAETLADALYRELMREVG